DVMQEATLAEWGARQETLMVEAYQAWQSSERFPMLGAMTGVGSMRGIVFNDTPNASGAEHLAALLAAGRKAGILLMPSGRKRNILRLLPPLTTEPEILKEGLDLIEQALETLSA
ncbi:MAG: aminotransferase class III-fold pyridoxal phosphate-dependent enzyme, partial [Halomonas sp.]